MALWLIVVQIEELMKSPEGLRSYMVEELNLKPDVVDGLLESSISFAKVNLSFIYRETS